MAENFKIRQGFSFEPQFWPSLCKFTDSFESNDTFSATIARIYLTLLALNFFASPEKIRVIFWGDEESDRDTAAMSAAPFDMGPALKVSPLIKTARWTLLLAGMYYGYKREEHHESNWTWKFLGGFSLKVFPEKHDRWGGRFSIV